MTQVEKVAEIVKDIDDLVKANKDNKDFSVSAVGVIAVTNKKTKETTATMLLEGTNLDIITTYMKFDETFAEFIQKQNPPKTVVVKAGGVVVNPKPKHTDDKKICSRCGEIFDLDLIDFDFDDEGRCGSCIEDEYYENKAMSYGIIDEMLEK